VAGLPVKIVACLFGFTTKTFQRALHPSLKPTLIGRAAKKKTVKSHVPVSVMQDARQILDVLAPIKSGKVYRIVSCPLNFLYEQYRALASQINPLPPVSYKTFIYKVLDVAHNYVHFENSPDFCPLCRELDELQLIAPATLTPAQTQRIVFLQEHQRIARSQWKIHHQCMEKLLRNPAFRLVVQDFNQQHANTSIQTQVLSLVVYGAPHGFLERHYFNYFLPSDQSNNLTAVIACHRDFFFNPRNTFIYEAKHIDVFNDGGPKHFKLTGYLAHMATVFDALQQRAVSLIQHYFASYHGSGPAVAVASHMKRKIRNIRANFRHNPKSVQEMASICSQIENTDKSTAIQIAPDLLSEESSVAVPTFTGIKSFHKATFAAGHSVSLWTDSSSTEPSITKQLSATGVLI